jgi:hypothetical protein
VLRGRRIRRPPKTRCGTPPAPTQRSAPEPAVIASRPCCGAAVLRIGCRLHSFGCW